MPVSSRNAERVCGCVCVCVFIRIVCYMYMGNIELERCVVEKMSTLANPPVLRYRATRKSGESGAGIFV